MADIIFEEIQPYIEGEGDTGKTSREKINRNFQKLKGFGDAVRDIAKMKNDIDGKVDKTSNQETFIEDASDCDTYVDSEGNTVAKIGELGEGKKGIQASDFFDKDGNSITNRLTVAEESLAEVGEQVDSKLEKESSEEQTLSDSSAAEYWVDKRGNIGMFLDRNGILHVRKVETNDSGEEQIEIEIDNSDEEIWCDIYGNIGMRLCKNGEFQVGKFTDGTIKNRFLLPKYIYCMYGVQRNIWHQSILARWNPYDYYLLFEGNSNYQRRTPLVATIKTKNPNSYEDNMPEKHQTGNVTGSTLLVSLIDNLRMEMIQQKICYLRVSSPRAENDGLGLIKVSFIGSSTTQASYFKEAFQRYVSNYMLVGLRHAVDDYDIIHEGHGGITLANLFAQQNTAENAQFLPFWQPSGNNRYWGSTGFWILAKQYINTQDSKIYGAYQSGCYVDSALSLFDGTTGKLKNPTAGDIMFDTNNEQYIRYNGNEWDENVAITDYTWSFQYGKYLEMWNLPCPDVVVICLGSNDFREKEFPLDFDTWNTQAEAAINSIKEAGDSQSTPVDVKVVLCNQGPFGNNGNDGRATALMNYKMWLHLKDLLDVFGNREDEGIYVLAQGSEISSEYGFRTIMTGKNTWPGQSIYPEEPVVTFPTTDWSLVFPTELYHEIYNNNDYPKTVDGSTERASVPEEKMKVLNSDTVHPELSYANMGVPIAAFLQYIRQNNNNN